MAHIEAASSADRQPFASELQRKHGSHGYVAYCHKHKPRQGIRAAGGLLSSAPERCLQRNSPGSRCRDRYLLREDAGTAQVDSE